MILYIKIVKKDINMYIVFRVNKLVLLCLYYERLKYKYKIIVFFFSNSGLFENVIYL